MKIYPPILAFFCGVLTLQTLAFLSNWHYLLFGIIAMLALNIIFYKKISPNFKKIFYCLIFYLCGFFWALFYATQIAFWSLPINLENQEISIDGYVATIPEINSHYTKFLFVSNNIADQKISAKLSLSWYGNKNQIPGINAGDKWQLHVKLKRPHGTLNLGESDYEKYLFVNHIRATGYVLAGTKIAPTHKYFINYIRQKLAQKINLAIFDQQNLGIINALVLGDESKITHNEWQIMRDTGTSFLVAISGLHIAFVAMLIFFVIKKLWSFTPKFALIIPAQIIAAIFALFAGIFYSVITGLSLPTQRALIMLSVFLLGIILRKFTDQWHNWFLALFIVLLLNPLSCLESGFWLSFSAVAAIIYVAKNTQAKNYFTKYLQMQFAVTIGILPFSLLFFQEISFAAIIANLIALPGICSVVVPLSLLGTVLLPLNFNFGKYILLLAIKITNLIYFWLDYISKQNYLTKLIWYQPIYNLPILISTIIAVVLLLNRKKIIKFLSIIFFLPIIFYHPDKPKDGEIWFTLLDVGQGLASVIETAHHTIIYDTGPKFGNTDAGESIVVPFLHARGIKNVDMMVVSHGDEDHIGGADSILNMLPVKSIYTSVPEKINGICKGATRCAHSKVFVQNCFAGESFDFDGIHLQFLHPPKNTEFDGNNASCVLRIDNGVHSILLTGDIQKPAEEDILAHNNNLQSDIIVAPHHGSFYSSTPEFINAIAPKFVLFPVGYLNRFHFPAIDVVERYINVGAKYFDTANYGAITFKLNKENNIDLPNLYRKQNKHYWNE